MSLRSFAPWACSPPRVWRPPPAPGPAAPLYKWVDEQGVTHYGDHIPPEYAAQEQQVINSQGVEISRLEAQKTPEQLAAEEQKKIEAQQSARTGTRIC